MTDLFSSSNNTHRINLTTSSARIELASLGITAKKTLRLFLDATSPAFIALGKSDLVAEIPSNGGNANGMPIGAGRETGITVKGGTKYLAAIMGSGTGVLYITVGEGI